MTANNKRLGTAVRKRLNGDPVDTVAFEHAFESTDPLDPFAPTVVTTIHVNGIQVAGYGVTLADDGVIDVITIPFGGDA